MSDLIKPQEISVKDCDGVEKTFIISRLPATVSREILMKYPVANIPKIGDFKVSTEAMNLMMGYVAAIPKEGEPIRLKTQQLIDNHVVDGEQLMRLEMNMLMYNTSFFGKGGNSDFLGALIRKYLPLITQTLTGSLQPSPAQDKPPTESSNLQ